MGQLTRVAAEDCRPHSSPTSVGQELRLDVKFGATLMAMRVHEPHSFSLQELSSFIRVLPLVSWTAGPDGEFEGVNVPGNLQPSSSDSARETLLAIIPREDESSFLDSWTNHVAGGKGFCMPFRLQLQGEAHPSWHQAHVTPQRDENGTPAGWLAVCHNIEKQHEAQEKLRECEARLESVVENLPVGLIILDRDRNPIRWNSKFVELRGLEVEAANWVIPLHPDDRAAVVNSWENAIKEGRSWSGVYRLVHPDGKVVWVSARANVISREGECLGFIRTAEDVTEIKIAEEQLARKNHELHDLARRLDAEVQHRTARLQEALAELDKLSYAIVHDMRAPLRTIIGFSEILLEEHARDLGNEARQLLSRMAAAARRQDLLIDNVLAYHSYVRADFPLEPVNLDQLVNGILGTYPNLQPSKAHIAVLHPLGWVVAHEALLAQCVSALLNNACKFVAANVVPAVRVHSEKGHNSIKLWIEDNGIGIEPEHHAKIFNIFEVLNKELYPGTGIGLPLARKAVERMHGAIGVESAPGQGSRFWIELPSLARNDYLEPQMNTR